VSLNIWSEICRSSSLTSRHLALAEHLTFQDWVHRRLIAFTNSLDCSADFNNKNLKASDFLKGSFQNRNEWKDPSFIL